jgi:predicted ATPase
VIFEASSKKIPIRLSSLMIAPTSVNGGAAGATGSAVAGGAGDIDGALALFVSALEVASTTGERWYEPELLRFKAEMLLAQPKQLAIEAEQCLKAAIALARQQEAKFWELRAVAALAKLWANQSLATKDVISLRRAMPGSSKVSRPPI